MISTLIANSVLTFIIGRVDSCVFVYETAISHQYNLNRREEFFMKTRSKITCASLALLIGWKFPVIHNTNISCKKQNLRKNVSSSLQTSTQKRSYFR